MILAGWILWLFFIIKYGGISSIKKWLGKPKAAFGWNVLAIFIGLLPLPLFLLHSETLSSWQIWVPWIILALVNPWIEEFYWRGLLMDYTEKWSKWLAVIFTSVLFAINHAAFGLNSELNSGFTIVVSTFAMGLLWAIVYHKTHSLRWVILAHFLVDFFNLSAASFLDLYSSSY